jgi:hypothetical protein
VFTPDTDGLDYYGRIEEIYELSFHGRINLHPIIFRCHWFDPGVTKKIPHLGLVEIQQDDIYPRDDVYIVAQQATQVYNTLYTCKTREDLKGWYVVYKVSPYGRLPVPNDEDYNFNPNTYDGEFFQEEGLQGRFEIDLTGEIGIGANYEMVDGDGAGEEVQNANDLQMLDRLRLGKAHEDNIPPLDNVDYFDMVDSDDETYDPANADHEDYL